MIRVIIRGIDPDHYSTVWSTYHLNSPRNTEDGSAPVVGTLSSDKAGSVRDIVED